MADWHGIDTSSGSIYGEHEGQYSIAGWGDLNGTWYDVENGDMPLEDLGEDNLWTVGAATIHYTSEYGDDLYFTLHGGWEDWDSLEDLIADSLDPYGVN